MLRSRMRIDTTGNPSYERQHDERSLLSVGSFEDVCGISPNSYVHINFDDVVDFAPASERALSTDIDMNDWQMFPSLPHSPYNNPRSVSGESNGHARQDVSQRVPRNFSVPSSSSSAGHSTGHLLSPYTSSPEERFSSTPFLSSAQPQHQQASMDQQTLDAMFAFTTAAQAQFQNLTTTAPAYTSRLSRHAVPRYPHQMGYNTSAHGMPIQESWSTQGPTRIPYTADAGAPVFGLDYTLSDASFNHFSVPATTAPTGTDYSISPGTRDSPMNQQHQPQWPLPTMSGPFEDQSYLDTSLLMAVEGGGAELERTMSFPHSLTSSEVGTSRQQHDSSDDVGTVSGPRKLSITPPVYIKQEDQPMTHSRIKNYRFEPYASPAAPHPHLRQVGPRRPPTSRRVGGRILGTKFDPQKAEKIKERREDGACWVCSLQRDEVRHLPRIYIWFFHAVVALMKRFNIWSIVLWRSDLSPLYATRQSP